MGRSVALFRVVALWLLVAGCATLHGYPETSSNPDAEFKALARYFQPDLVQQCMNEQDIAKRRACRDEILNARIRDIDLHFSVFQKGLFKEGVSSSTAVDWAVLGLNAVGAVAGTAGTKAALSAASGGLIGAKGSFDKNVYFDKTMPVILTRMIAERKKVLATLREGMAKENIEEYPLHRALIDVEDYYAAGTIPGAIMAVTQDAGKTAQDATQRMEIVFQRSSGIVEPERQQRVEQILNDIENLSKSAGFSLNNNPPASEPAIEKVIELRDPHNRRFFDPKVAKEMLKMRVVMSKRSIEDLAAWEAALRAVQ